MYLRMVHFLLWTEVPKSIFPAHLHQITRSPFWLHWAQRNRFSNYSSDKNLFTASNSGKGSHLFSVFLHVLSLVTRSCIICLERTFIFICFSSVLPNLPPPYLYLYFCTCPYVIQFRSQIGVREATQRFARQKPTTIMSGHRIPSAQKPGKLEA